MSVVSNIRKDFQMIRGDTLAFGIEIFGIRTDLDTAFFTVKKKPDDKNFVFQRSLGNGITKIKNGIYRCRIDPDNTKNISPGDYCYDLQISIGKDVKTILMGLFKVYQDVTL